MNFSELGLAKRICDDVETLGFTEPTEIQMKAIPPILAGKDIMASAETGSGKTAAYGLPIVQALRGGSQRLPRVLILVPTRELAVQVNDEIIRFANNCGIRTVTIYGGVGFEKQVRLLKRGVDVIVATPGRLFDHIEQGNAQLKNVNMLVLDEADRMLDMGFTPQVRRIVDEIEGQRQTVMFSATINKAVERSGEEFLKDPVSICVNSDRVEPASIEQKIHIVQEGEKTSLLIKIVKEETEQPTVLVFTKTRHRAAKICSMLNAASIRAGEIHSDISQNKRESTLKQFRSGQITVLVATDIAARGLDVPAISHVVNFDLPLSAADYVHRIGRTGRAGRSGIALSFVSDDQRYLIRDIEKVTGRSLDPNSPFSDSRNGSGNRKSRVHRKTARRERTNSEPRHYGDSGSSSQSASHAGAQQPFSRRRSPEQATHSIRSNRSEEFLQRGQNDAPRTQRDDRGYAPAGAAPRDRFDSFKKKRAEGSFTFGGVEASPAKPSGQGTFSRNRPAPNSNSQGRTSDYRGGARKPSNSGSTRPRSY